MCKSIHAKNSMAFYLLFLDTYCLSANGWIKIKFYIFILIQILFSINFDNNGILWNSTAQVFGFK